MIRVSFYFLFLFAGIVVFSQPVKVTEIVSENKIAGYNNQKLVVVDFWATWCGPCIPATEQLEILQKNKKEKIFVVSISDEPVPVIQKYLTKHPAQLMVVSDYESYTFNKYKVTHRPFAVLIDENGKVLWSGHPGDLRPDLVDKFFLKSPKPPKTLDMNWLEIAKKKSVEVLSVLTDKEPIKIEETNQVVEEFSVQNDEIHFSGTLKDLIIKLKKITSFEIEMEGLGITGVKIQVKKEIWDKNPEKVFEKIIAFFHLKYSYGTKVINASEVIPVNENLLWDTNQFEWNDEANRFIIGMDRIQADNMSVSEVCKLLSKTKSKYYFYKGTNESKHDWDFNFLYDNLLSEEFETSFGLVFKSVKTTLKTLKIQKKE